MSDAGVEVQAYEVLPKEVAAEVGSIKLFSTLFCPMQQTPHFDCGTTSKTVKTRRWGTQTLTGVNYRPLELR